MNKTTKIIIALVVVAVIAAGAVLLTSKKTADETPGGAPSSGNDETVTITYTDDGFSPKEVTIASGGSVTVVNESGKEAEPASDPHPSHTNNPELNFGDIEPGGRKTLTLTAKGAWGIHNHYNKDHRGTVTVE